MYSLTSSIQKSGGLLECIEPNTIQFSVWLSITHFFPFPIAHHLCANGLEARMRNAITSPRDIPGLHMDVMYVCANTCQQTKLLTPIQSEWNSWGKRNSDFSCILRGRVKSYSSGQPLRGRNAAHQQFRV
jgi:hypothetical protein